MQKTKPKVAIIGTNGLPGKYGGWDQLLNHLTINLREKFSFIIYTSYYNAEKGLKEFNGAKLKIIRLKANGFQSVLYDIISLIHAAFKYDVLLVLGTSGCIFLPIIRLSRKKIILNPDGCEWKRGKWNKPVQTFLRLSEKFGIKYSDMIISDNVKIQEYIKKTYNKHSELIEYGGDQATFVFLSEETKKKYALEIGNYAFKVCRIEPENNIDVILEAFKETTMDIVIVGNWNFSKYGKDLRTKYGNNKNLKLLDPIYDQSSLNEIRSNCGLYIHGHSVGGTNPSLVEAMNIGLCPIVYNVDYNIETTENQAIYFNSKEDLIKIISKYQNKEIDTSFYKEKMKEIAQRRYTWKIITDKYSDVFLKEN
jgi:glycosyltransferase involved in cell wall biosynthesis